MNDPLISTKDHVGINDAIETAKPGEPLFALQGGDPFAPSTILHWAGLCRAAGLIEADAEKAKRMLTKASDAELVAWAMRSYQNNEQASDSEGQRARYADAPLIDVDDMQAARKALILSIAILNNATAQLVDVFETLARLRVHPEQEVKLREAAAAIKEVALAIEPRRGNERT